MICEHEYMNMPPPLIIELAKALNLFFSSGILDVFDRRQKGRIASIMIWYNKVY
jgi:hypothetical protein